MAFSNWRSTLAFSVLLACVLTVGAQTDEARKPAAKTALDKTPVVQPIPFSHKLHAGTLKLACLGCHVIPDPGYAAGYPKESFCMTCHTAIKADSPAIQKLAGFEKEGKSVPWEKVYAVPDYVYFSHQYHHKEADIACETCHGPVATRTVLGKEKETSMEACMECHTEYKASNECNICHNF